MDNQRNTEPTRETAYTFPRHDVCSMVPVGAIDVLDVGCSNGSLGASLKTLSNTRKIVGIERDPEFVLEASRRLDEVLQADLDGLDWEATLGGRQFDCIIFADVLEHLQDPAGQLDKARHHLREGGCIVISLPNVRHHTALWSIWIQGRFPRRNRGIFDKTHIRWFTMNDAKELAHLAGMNVQSTYCVLRWGDLGGGFVNKLLNKLPQSIRHIAPLREFFTYQFCMRLNVARRH